MGKRNCFSRETRYTLSGSGVPMQQAIKPMLSGTPHSPLFGEVRPS